MLRAKVGDQLKVGLLEGNCGEGEVTLLTEAVAELRVQLHRPPPAKLPLTLVLALPRPKAARRILRAATELGVSDIILLNSYRVEKSYWQSPLVAQAQLQAALLEALEQTGDTRLPSLRRELRFKPFVEDQLPALLVNTRGLLAHPYATTALTSASGNTLLAIGPEGGFIPYEIEKLQEAGLRGFHLGSRVLRTETARDYRRPVSPWRPARGSVILLAAR